MFNQPPWVFENAPFHWYRPLRQWIAWYADHQREQAAAIRRGEDIGSWDTERFTGEYT